MYMIDILEEKFKEDLFTAKEISLYEKMSSLPSKKIFIKSNKIFKI
jgi:hypothetical protein